MTNIQPVSKIEQNLISIDNHLNDCLSEVELWETSENLHVLKVAAQISKRKDIAVKAGALICRAEFYLAKKLDLPSRAYRKLPKEERDKEDDLGLNKDIKYKLRKAYKTLDENVFNEKIEELKGKNIVPTRYFFSNDESYQRFSGEYEYYTAPRIIEAVRAIFGGIDLDPASSKEANETVEATKYFTKEDDGLAQDWRPYKTIWINPPFTHLKEFAVKFVREAKGGAFLGRTDLTAGWGAILANSCSCAFFPKNKVPFYNAKGERRSTVAMVIFFLNADPREVTKVFKEFRVDGTSMVPFSQHLKAGEKK